MYKPYHTRAAAMAAVEAAVKSGRIDSGEARTPNGIHWHAHARKGTVSFCL